MKTVKLHKGANNKLPYLKGVIQIGYGSDSFKVNGPLDKSLKTIIEKYGILPEQLYSVSMVSMSTVILGLSVWSTFCITMIA